MNSIIELAVRARTVADVDRLEAALRTTLGMEKVRYLGDREANFSALSSPADTTSVLFERVTNMQDAIIELEAQRCSQFDLPNPVAAAAAFFGITGGIAAMPAHSRDALARRCVITLQDSDDPVRRPTISFRDTGIGLTFSEMPSTILSLEGSNKLRKAYLQGIFGKGGSSACVFSDATIILSRKHTDLLNQAEDRVSIAVVREADSPDVGLPFYRYLVGADDLPFSVPASEAPEFDPGTLVIHVNYQAGRMGQQNWEYEESIYALAETILFKPVLPYSLEDARAGAANKRPEHRRKPSTLSGLAQRLESNTRADGLLARSNWSTIAVPEVGNVRTRWWLYENADRRRRRAAKGYVALFTTNGQVHHVWDQGRLQYFVPRRPRVSDRLIIEVDCDGIELKRRYKVFDSFRAQVRKGPEGRALEQAVADAVEADPDLEEAESDFLRQSLVASSQRVSSGFRDRLNKAIRLKIPGYAAASMTTRHRPPRPKDHVELYAEPTMFTGLEAVLVAAGATASFYMEVNATDGFVPDRGEVLWTIEPAAELAISVGDLRKGRLRIGVTTLEDTPAGCYTVTLRLVWERAPNGLVWIDWPLAVKVESRESVRPLTPASDVGITSMTPARSGARSPRAVTKAATGDFAFIWSDCTEQDWTADIAGELQYPKGDDLAAIDPGNYGHLKGIVDAVPTVVLNKEFTELDAYHRTVARRVRDQSVNLRLERYALAVGVAVANLYLNEQRLQERVDASQLDPADVEAPMSPEQRHRAIAETARGVLALMPDFDKLLGDEEPIVREEQIKALFSSTL